MCTLSELEHVEFSIFFQSVDHFFRQIFCASSPYRTGPIWTGM